MVTISEMDARISLQMQLEEPGGPVILINKVNVAPEDVDAFIAAWTTAALYLKTQPGCISIQLHRGIGGSCVFIEYTVWETVEDFKRASASAEFQANFSLYPASMEATPHLFHKVAVPRICVG